MKPFVAKLIASGFFVLACTAFLAALASAVFLLRRQPKAPPETDPEWAGHGIDVTPISPRLRRMRSGFRSLFSLGPDEARHRRRTLELKRREMARLAYFRNRAESDPAPLPRSVETLDA